MGHVIYNNHMCARTLHICDRQLGAFACARPAQSCVDAVCARVFARYRAVVICCCCSAAAPSEPYIYKTQIEFNNTNYHRTKTMMSDARARARNKRPPPINFVRGHTQTDQTHTPHTQSGSQENPLHTFFACVTFCVQASALLAARFAVTVLGHLVCAAVLAHYSVVYFFINFTSLHRERSAPRARARSHI